MMKEDEYCLCTWQSNSKVKNKAKNHCKHAGTYLRRPSRKALNLCRLCLSCGSVATLTCKLYKAWVFGPKGPQGKTRQLISEVVGPFNSCLTQQWINNLSLLNYSCITLPKCSITQQDIVHEKKSEGRGEGILDDAGRKIRGMTDGWFNTAGILSARKTEMCAQRNKEMEQSRNKIQFIPGLVEAWTNPQGEFGLRPVMRSLWWGLSPSQRSPCRAGQRHCNTSRPRAGFTLLSPERAWLERKEKARQKRRMKKKKCIGKEAVWIRMGKSRNGKQKHKNNVSEVTHKLRWRFKYRTYRCESGQIKKMILSMYRIE